MARSYHHGALRLALLDAAEKILERDGIGGLTLRAAAREAGVSHAAPTHHFGNISGLLSALAASGFIRFRTRIEEEIAAAPPGEAAVGVRRGYLAFAVGSPALFQLMFRSEQLDWSNQVLAEAGAAAFGLLAPADGSGPLDIDALAQSMAEWSMLHGLSTLLIDGRLDAVAMELLPGVNIQELIDRVLRKSPCR